MKTSLQSAYHTRAVRPRFRTQWWVAAFVAVCALADIVDAQSPQLPFASAPALRANQSATAAITFASGVSLTVRAGKDGSFPLVAADPGETLNLQVRFPATAAKIKLVVQVLDGGVVPQAQQDSVLGTDGTISIQFQVPNQAGLYRILFNGNGVSATLNFWVAGAQNESPNAAALKP
jgi:hypothetical protein